MKILQSAMTVAMAFASSAALAQTAPAPATPAQMAPSPAPVSAADAGPALSDKEQKTLKRCQAMPYQYQMQSSKCTDLMKKAGVKPVEPQQPRQ